VKVPKTNAIPQNRFSKIVEVMNQQLTTQSPLRFCRGGLCGFAWNQSDDNIGVQDGSDATK
jgi:hypothetical protein